MAVDCDDLKAQYKKLNDDLWEKNNFVKIWDEKIVENTRLDNQAWAEIEECKKKLSKASDAYYADQGDHEKQKAFADAQYDLEAATKKEDAIGEDVKRAIGMRSDLSSEAKDLAWKLDNVADDIKKNGC